MPVIFNKLNSTYVIKETLKCLSTCENIADNVDDSINVSFSLVCLEQAEIYLLAIKKCC